jgi:serine/threonine-protein kinase
LVRQHNYAQAILYYTRAIAAKPNYRVYFGRASAYRQLGQMDKAVADYSQAILLNPDSAAAFRDRAFCELRLGLAKNAADDYDQALKLDPHNPRTWNDRGAIYLEKGGYHKAQDCFTRYWLVTENADRVCA